MDQVVKVSAAILINLAAIAQVHAATLAVPEYKFAIDIPQNWSKQTVTGHVVAKIQSADGNKSVIVLAVSIPPAERPTAAQAMMQGAREEGDKIGWKVIGERSVANNHLSFDTFTARMPNGATITDWVTATSEMAYSLEGINKTGNADTDAEIQSVLTSFHLLPAGTSPVNETYKRGLAYRLGYAFPTVFLLALVVVGIVWLVRRGGTKSRGVN